MRPRPCGPVESGVHVWTGLNGHTFTSKHTHPRLPHAHAKGFSLVLSPSVFLSPLSPPKLKSTSVFPWSCFVTNNIQIKLT